MYSKTVLLPETATVFLTRTTLPCFWHDQWTCIPLHPLLSKVLRSFIFVLFHVVLVHPCMSHLPNHCVSDTTISTVFLTRSTKPCFWHDQCTRTPSCIPKQEPCFWHELQFILYICIHMYIHLCFHLYIYIHISIYVNNFFTVYLRNLSIYGFFCRTGGDLLVKNEVSWVGCVVYVLNVYTGRTYSYATTTTTVTTTTETTTFVFVFFSSIQSERTLRRLELCK